MKKKLIFGFDISTTKIGIAILNEKEEILQSESLIYPQESLSLEEKAERFFNRLTIMIKLISDKLFVESDIVLIVEEPAKSFMKGKSNPQTIAMLQRFNGMCCFGLYHSFKVIPKLVNPRTVRKTLGIKVPKELTQKKKKMFIIDWVVEKMGMMFDKNGGGKNYVDGADDEAEAVLCALSEIRKNEKG